MTTAQIQRYAASVQYKGTDYHGWQSQHHLITVAGKLEEAIAEIANHPVHVYCAGRTDKGVHALGQVIHFDSLSKRNLHNWLLGVNRYLPNDISMDWIVPVNASFHARFSAVARQYVYLIYTSAARPALGYQYMAWTYRSLDMMSMRQAAQCLVGEHDFTSFRSGECQSLTPFRKIHHINIYARNQLIFIDIKANAFLHHMVRNIVGSLVEIGKGKQPVHWLKQVLAAKDRAQAGETAPPEGLYLAKVSYPLVYDLPEPPVMPGLG